MVAQTSRLYLRQFLPTDAFSFYNLNQDPEVLRFTGDTPFADEAAAHRFLVAYDQYRLYGFGRWAVIRRKDEAYLGWCGLKYTPDPQEVDLGFRFFRSHWNQGYATEAAACSLSLAWSSFQLTRVVGRANTKNLASIRVLEKVGMSFWENREIAGVSWKIYQASNPFLA